MKRKCAPTPWRYEDNGFDGHIVDAEDEVVFGGEPREGRIEPHDPNMKMVLALVNLCEETIQTLRDLREIALSVDGLSAQQVVDLDALIDKLVKG